MAKVYGIISGKGGTGKTTSAINLGAALMSLEKDTLVVDANLSTPNIGLHLGAPLTPLTLNHVLSGKADIMDAIYEHESGLKVVPSSISTTELRKVKHKNLVDVVKQLKKLSQHVILDSSPGLGEETEAVINAADEIILITQAEMPSVTDTLKTAKLAKSLNKYIKGFIVTRHKGKKTEMPIENIKDILELPLLGIIPEDKNMQKALLLKKPIVYSHPRSNASRAYKTIAKRILGNIGKEKGFFSRLFSS